MFEGCSLLHTLLLGRDAGVGHRRDAVGVAQVVFTQHFGLAFAKTGHHRQESAVEHVQLLEFFLHRAPHTLVNRVVDLHALLDHGIGGRRGGVLTRVLACQGVSRARNALCVVDEQAQKLEKHL